MNANANADSKLRLQVFLSRNGIASRRKAFDLIQEGYVKLNGKVVLEPSTPVNLNDKVEVNGQLIVNKKFDYILMNKPAGVTTTKEDIHAEQTVIDLLPEQFKHLVPVGRLDKDTEGLLLLTNDGDLTFKLTHPKFDVNKTYLVRIKGMLNDDIKKQLEDGIMLEGRKTFPAKIDHIKSKNRETEFTMTIHEGRKRQIRNMLGSFKLLVVYLKRLSQGPLVLGDLPRGKWRVLSPSEADSLLSFIKTL
jgi:23S rRNA pseudouridine2605 synthase